MIKSQASGLHGTLGGGDRMKLLVIIMSLHSFYGLTTNKGQAKDFIGMMLEIKLGYGGVGKVYLIVLEFLIEALEAVNGHLEIQKPTNNSRVGIEMECFLT